ncbi:transcriptional regulator domain-containing protein [Bradyrhizobium sp. USDA 4341]
MSGEWRSEESYGGLKKADAADLAWEWLRRNPDYQKDYMELLSRERTSATTAQFRRKWGLAFRS